jgi:hypothetical protein
MFAIQQERTGSDDNTSQTATVSREKGSRTEIVSLSGLCVRHDKVTNVRMFVLELDEDQAILSLWL